MRPWSSAFPTLTLVLDEGQPVQHLKGRFFPAASSAIPASPGGLGRVLGPLLLGRLSALGGLFLSHSHGRDRCTCVLRISASSPDLFSWFQASGSNCLLDARSWVSCKPPKFICPEPTTEPTHSPLSMPTLAPQYLASINGVNNCSAPQIGSFGIILHNPSRRPSPRSCSHAPR